MTEQRFLHSFPKSETEEVRVSLREYKDRVYLDLRLWYQPSEGDWRPTKKGLTLALQFLPELRKGLDKAEKEANALVEAR